jgi:hypothetical protein
MKRVMFCLHRSLRSPPAIWVLFLSLIFSIGSIWRPLAADSDVGWAEPPQALSAGYGTLTFSSSFKPETVDARGTLRSGYQWYPWKFFGGSMTRLENIVVTPDNGLVLEGDTTGPNGQIATAAPDSKSGFVGNAFGGGGYFEATLAFNPDDVFRMKFKGWPAWWAMASEHLLPERVSSQGGGSYEDFIEVDFFEYDLAKEVREGWRNSFGGAVHEWFGIYNKTCPNQSYCRRSFSYEAIVRRLPADVELNEFHKYGVLWVPASDEADGYIEHYFDNKKVGGRLAWKKCDNSAGSDGGQLLLPFCVIDKNHLVIIFGTGASEPLQVRSFRIWQKSSKFNILGCGAKNRGN